MKQVRETGSSEVELPTIDENAELAERATAYAESECANLKFELDLRDLVELVEAVQLPTRDAGILANVAKLNEKQVEEAVALMDPGGQLQKVLVCITPSHLVIVNESNGVKCEAWKPISWASEAPSALPVAFEMQDWRIRQLADHAIPAGHLQSGSDSQRSRPQPHHLCLTYDQSEGALHVQFPKKGARSKLPTSGTKLTFRVQSTALPMLPLRPRVPVEANFSPRLLSKALSKVRCATSTIAKLEPARWVYVGHRSVLGAKNSLAARYQSAAPIVPVSSFSLSVRKANVLRSVLGRLPRLCHFDREAELLVIQSAGLRCTVDCTSRPVPDLGGAFDAASTPGASFKYDRDTLLQGVLFCKAAAGRIPSDEPSYRYRDAIYLAITSLADEVEVSADRAIPGWILDRAKVTASELAEAPVLIMAAKDGDNLAVWVQPLQERQVELLHSVIEVSLSSLEKAISACSALRLELAMQETHLRLTSIEDEGEARYIVPRSL